MESVASAALIGLWAADGPSFLLLLRANAWFSCTCTQARTSWVEERHESINLLWSF